MAVENASFTDDMPMKNTCIKTVDFPLPSLIAGGYKLLSHFQSTELKGQWHKNTGTIKLKPCTNSGHVLRF